MSKHDILRRILPLNQTIYNFIFLICNFIFSSDLYLEKSVISNIMSYINRECNDCFELKKYKCGQERKPSRKILEAINSHKIIDNTI